MALIRLIYVSSTTRQAGDEDLAQILATAREFNGQNGITGMLLFSDGNFMQVLEGEDTIVGKLMDEHIARDTRHQHIIVLEREPIAERDFPDWSMGFRHLDSGLPADRDGRVTINSLLNGSAKDIRPGAALELLQMFAQH